MEMTVPIDEEQYPSEKSLSLVQTLQGRIRDTGDKDCEVLCPIASGVDTVSCVDVYILVVRWLLYDGRGWVALLSSS